MNIMNRKRNLLLSPEFLTGLFCIGALCILFYFTVVIRGKDFFDTRKHFYISARFPHASTLAVNDKVKIIGVEMGTVDSLELAPGNNAVIVKMKLRKDIRIYQGYEMLIQNSSVFGGAYVNINPGAPEGEPFPADTVFDGLPPIDIIKEASELIAAFREDEKYFREVILEGGVLEKIRDALKRIEENAKNLNDICEEIKAGKGTLGKLFTDPAFYVDAQKAFVELSAFSKKFDAILAEIQSGKGTLGKLLNDEEAYREMTAFMKNMNAFAVKLNADKGSLAKFMMDDGRFYNNLNSTLENLDTLAKMMSNKKGTMNKLITDDSLYYEMRDTVREIRSAVDDLREMAPVATFGSVLLGAL